MSLYHMYVAAFGPPEAIIFRGTHLLFALTLVFLLYPTRPGKPAWRLLDVALLALGFGFVLHIFLNYDYFIDRIIYIDELTVSDRVYAVAAVAIVLEATRRILGLALPLTAIAFLVYAIGFTRVTPDVLMEQLYLSTEGIFGSTLGVSASYVMLFVLFGAFMEKSGTGQLFMDFAMSLTGHQAGGPGKVAVVSSSLFGTVSGSAVANVMVDGPITIPLMKRTGFRPPFAAAVEAVASTGGQIMPPVMGAAAFVMAEFLAVPYAQVAVWAAVPALLYYVAVFFAVHFEAKRYGLAGVPRSELPRFATVMAVRGHLFIPILVVLFGLMLGYSAPRCALAGALACIPVALLRAATREGITLAQRARRARRRRAQYARCRDGVRLRGDRDRLRDDHRSRNRVHPVRHRPFAEFARGGARADGARGHRARDGNADDAVVHRDGVAARSRGDQARGHRAGRAHVRVLFRDPLGDHAAGRAGGFRRGRPREDGHLGDGPGIGAAGGARLHHPVHVHLRAVAAADRGLGDEPHLDGQCRDRRHVPRRGSSGLHAARDVPVGARR